MTADEPGHDAASGPSAITGPLEALLLMATEPMSTAELAQALGAPKPVVWEALDELRAFYDDTRRGFELREAGGGWRYHTRAEHHDAIAAWVLDGQHARLSQAALETLAVVAYLQPISRSRVGAVRGVNVDGVMRTLVTRRLVEEAERDQETGATLFRTTGTFLERMGLRSLDELPPLAPHLPEASLLEAELAGFLSDAADSDILAATDRRKDEPMAPDLLPTEPDHTPIDTTPTQDALEDAREIPDKALLERLEEPDAASDPEGTQE